MMLQRPLWSLLCDHYFRLEVSGWERLLAQTSLSVGAHSGEALTMDAWTLVAEWYRQYVDRICREVRAAIQAGMSRLAARRRFPVFE